MNDTQWTELLERAADRVAVAPPNVLLMQSAAAQRRRRSVLLAGLSAACVIGIIGGVALTASSEKGSSPDPAGVDDGGGSTAFREVGLGHVFVSVPSSWGTNRTRCGTPQADTVVLDVAVVETCGVSRPANVDSVEVVQGAPRFDFSADKSLVIDGEPAQRQSTVCTDQTFGVGEVCMGTVYFPGRETWVRVESSTSDEVVNELLDRVFVDPARSGVPGFARVALRDQDDSGETYARLLRDLGFQVDVRNVESAAPAGHVVSTRPAPGTVVAPGSAIAVLVSGAELPDCDELNVPVPTLPASLTQLGPDEDARHVAFDESGEVAAWFDETELLPELVVLDVARSKTLAREDLGVGDVAEQPSLRIIGNALYYRSAADSKVWLRYAWAKDTFPSAYRTCD